MQKSILNEKDTTVFNHSEIENGVIDEVSPRGISDEIMGYDVIKELREAKDNPNPVKIDTDKIIEEKFLSKHNTPKKDVKKNWTNKFIPVQKNVDSYEINNHTF